jgi:predicted DNA-binding transcriptional regulator AlpA
MSRKARVPELAGVSEVAQILGVSRQRARQLADDPRFPKPVAVLMSGPVWIAADVRAFLKTWPRRTGRPPQVPR